MTLTALILGYSGGISLLLVLLYGKWRTYRTWSHILLINPHSQFRVHRFFTEMGPVLKEFYPLLRSLLASTGHPITEVDFQLRWVVWWKFFGPRPLQQALRLFNESDFLRPVLQAPPKTYTREIFHTFRHKLAKQTLDQMMDYLIATIHEKGLLDWSTAMVDSAPRKSSLNTQKCLKRPTIDYDVLKQFVTQVRLDSGLTKLQPSPKMHPRMHPKVIALLVKEIWDMVSWNQCWKVLYGKKAKKAGLSLPYPYRTAQSLQQITEVLSCRTDAQEIEGR